MADYLTTRSFNLAVLTAIRLSNAWNADLNMITVVGEAGEIGPAREHLEVLRDLCRISSDAMSLVLVGTLADQVSRAPQSDMDIFGVRSGPDLTFLAEMMRATRSSCILTADSGHESALA
jgi:hypothetical protein